MTTTIQINAFQLKNWTLQDNAGAVEFDQTLSSGKVDGFNIRVSEKNKMGETWLSLEEMKSLRDWMNKTLDSLH